MKTSPFVLAAALAAGFLLPTARAAVVQTPVSTPDSASRLPFPVEVVRPTELPRRFVDATVEIAMTIDETGRPQNVTAVRRMPEDLAKRLLPVIEQWRFSPALQDGKPVPMRVILPLKLVGTDA